ncbi:hypothetical protein EON83_13290 [bacterium]|nr:MAG: hypothetical protein EON83_13290 [bacterium]
MDELLRIEAWIDSLDFSRWEDGDYEDIDDEQMQWVSARKSPLFDSQRQRVLAMVKAQEDYLPLTESESQVIALIRDKGVRRANFLSFVDGLSELAADDFVLLARAARVGVVDFWLDKLRAEYEAGRFPRGKL